MRFTEERTREKTEEERRLTETEQVSPFGCVHTSLHDIQLLVHGDVLEEVQRGHVPRGQQLLAMFATRILHRFQRIKWALTIVMAYFKEYPSLFEIDVVSNSSM